MRDIRLNVEADILLERPGVGTISITSDDNRNISIDFSSLRMLTQVVRFRPLVASLSAINNDVFVGVAGRMRAKLPMKLLRRLIK